MLKHDPAKVALADALLAQEARRQKEIDAAHKAADEKTLRLDSAVAAAVLVAGTSPTGSAVTAGSEHATRIRDGVVRLEMPTQEGGRQTVYLEVPPHITFTTTEE